MALKDAGDDVRRTHSLCVVEEPKLDAVAVKPVLVDVEEVKVGLARVGAVVGIDDGARGDVVQEVMLVPVVTDHVRDVDARQEDSCPLPVVHDRGLALQLHAVLVGVEGDPDLALQGRATKEFDVACVEQVEGTADVHARHQPTPSRVRNL